MYCKTQFTTKEYLSLNCEKITSEEDNLIGTQPQREMTSMEKRKPQWGTTSMEDDLNGIQPQSYTELINLILS